jgi:energy-converting hydrogenase A subunit M
MQQNPELDCQANRQMIAEDAKWNDRTVQESISALGNQLAFNQDVADKHTAQQLAAEREQLIDLLARNHSLSPLAQDQYRNTTLKRKTRIK